MPTYLFSNLTVQIENGDITTENVDAIVNAANSKLQHGGGVAAAIVTRGGYEIQRESDEWVKLHGSVTCDHPAITGPGSLPCRYIIHAVGPVWGTGDEVTKLKTAIYSSLLVANDLKCSSIAFPAISTGIFGFPVELASHCFQDTIEEFSSQKILFFVQLIKIVLFDERTFDIFQTTFSQTKDT
jgi:O-acetyl-ADP-ribose deacetylase (regulator of RNase III)